MNELADLLNPIIQRELATIGAIDTAMSLEDDPGFVVLFLATKQGKQANIGQMTAMLRAAGLQPAMTPARIETLLKLQAALLERVGTTPTLMAFQLTEGELVGRYAEAYEKLDGVWKKGIERAWHRAKKHLAVLTAHVAHPKSRACMRCLLDREGKNPAIERGDPHPYQYICAACHDEVLSDIAPDLIDKVLALPPRERENIVAEHAMSKPSKLKAEHLVLSKLANLAPDLPPPPMVRKKAIERAKKEHAPGQPAARVEIDWPALPAERLYAELLFDYESVRDNW